MFRTPEEEIKELAKELRELKDVLREISNKVAHIEARAKRSFPASFPKVPPGPRVPAQKISDPPSISPQQALELYDTLVATAKQGDKEDVQNRLKVMALPDLALLSRELGGSLGKSKPSRKVLMNAILGRISESMMLSTSSLRQRPERSGGRDEKERLAVEETKEGGSSLNTEAPTKDDSG